MTIWTKDLQAARKFYVEVLGLPVLEERPGNFFLVAIGGVPICIDLHSEQSGTQRNQIGVEVNDLDLTVDVLRGKGFEVSQGLRPDSGERWAAIKDPDGHEVIFIARPS